MLAICEKHAREPELVAIIVSLLGQRLPANHAKYVHGVGVDTPCQEVYRPGGYSNNSSRVVGAVKIQTISERGTGPSLRRVRRNCPQKLGSLYHLPTMVGGPYRARTTSSDSSQWN